MTAGARVKIMNFIMFCHSYSKIKCRCLQLCCYFVSETEYIVVSFTAIISNRRSLCWKKTGHPMLVFQSKLFGAWPSPYHSQCVLTAITRLLHQLVDYITVKLIKNYIFSVACPCKTHQHNAMELQAARALLSC